MKNLFYFVLMLITISSCKVVNMNKNSVIGIYTAKGVDYNYQLSLQSDNTFLLKFKSLEVNSGCEGKWELKSKDLIILTCNEPKDVTEALQSGYMNNRVVEVKIKSENYLSYKGILLKK
jgi:hypothetical protein